MAMDPVVTAAWIAGGTSIVSLAGTVTVAIFGFRAAEKVGVAANKAAVSNTEHFVNATRDDHLWEKRAHAYEDALAQINFRTLKRESDLRSYRFDELGEKNMAKFFETYQPESWFKVQARILAYASPEVLAAFELSTRADIEATVKFSTWESMAEQNRQIAQSGVAQPGGSSGEAAIKARSEAVAASEALQICDSRVIELIRAELHSIPQVTAPAR